VCLLLAVTNIIMDSKPILLDTGVRILGLSDVVNKSVRVSVVPPYFFNRRSDDERRGADFRSA
jgi:hypothetical protein